MRVRKEINVYLKGFSAFGVFEYSDEHEEYCGWQLISHEVTDGFCENDGDVQEALFEQLEKTIYDEIDRADFGGF